MCIYIHPYIHTYMDWSFKQTYINIRIKLQGVFFVVAVVVILWGFSKGFLDVHLLVSFKWCPVCLFRPGSRKGIFTWILLMRVYLNGHTTTERTGEWVRRSHLNPIIVLNRCFTRVVKIKLFRSFFIFCFCLNYYIFQTEFLNFKCQMWLPKNTEENILLSTNLFYFWNKSSVIGH